MIGLKLGLGLSCGQTGLNRYRIGTSMPALILDHARGFYAEGTPPVRDDFTDVVTFTRASEGYALDADGIWQKSLTNVPRYSWATGRRAQLIEAAATNKVTNSATLATQNVTVTATAHTLSFEGSGTVTLSGASTAGPLVGSGGRVSLTFTPTAGTLTLTVTGAVTNAQIEAGPVATSYIPTTSAAKARAADITSKSLAAYDFSTGITVSLEGRIVRNVGSFDALIELSDGSSNNIIRVYYSLSSGSLWSQVFAGGALQENTKLFVNLAEDFKAAISISAAGRLTVASGGVTQFNGTGKTLPTLNQVSIGRAFNGNNQVGIFHHHETLIKEGASTEAELKALTS